MGNNDKAKFKQIMDDCCECYGKNKLSVKVLAKYFNSFKDKSIDDFERAVNLHETSGHQGSWFPKISDLKVQFMIMNEFSTEWAD